MCTDLCHAQVNISFLSAPGKRAFAIRKLGRHGPIPVVRMRSNAISWRDAGGKILLNKATLHLKRGRRYGLCGHNGAGKVGIAMFQSLYIVLGRFHVQAHVFSLAQKMCASVQLPTSCSVAAGLSDVCTKMRGLLVLAHWVLPNAVGRFCSPPSCGQLPAASWTVFRPRRC